MTTLTRRNLLGGAAAVAVGAPLRTCLDGQAVADPFAPSRPTLEVGPGGWCWFQAPRASIAADGTLWLGATQGTAAPTPGAVDAWSIDLDALAVSGRHRLGVDRVDDHTSPSVLAVGDDVHVGWAPHRRADWLRLGRVGSPLAEVARPGALVAPGRGTSYVSAHVVGGDRWVLYRGERFSWNLLVAGPAGWIPKGLVIDPGDDGHRPYLVASAHGDVLHVAVSDGNPTEVRGSGVSVGTVHHDGTIADAAGTPVGAVGSRPAPVPRLTRIVDGSIGPNRAADTAAWPCDARIVDGRPTVLASVRDPWPETAHGVGRWRHRYRWAQADVAGRWHVEHLAEAGGELYGGQPDYSGLATLDPTDAATVVISTDVHPATGRPLRSRADDRIHHELFAGSRVEDGWTWRALTSDSVADNLRPVVAAGHGRRILAWMRGTYRSWGDFDTRIFVRLA